MEINTLRCIAGCAMDCNLCFQQLIKKKKTSKHHMGNVCGHISCYFLFYPSKGKYKIQSKI